MNSAQPPTHRLRRIVQLALLLRVILAVLLHFFSSEASFAPDQETYHFGGSRLARYWSGEDPTPPALVQRPGPRAYYYIVGALYYVFGFSPLAPKLLNACLGAMTIPILFDLALRVSGSVSVALRTATYAAYFPSLILWSVLNMRDVWIVFLIILVCQQAIALQSRFALKTLLILLVAVVLITGFRDYILLPISVPMLVSFFVRRRANLVRNTILGMLVAVIVIYADRAAGDRRLRAPDLEALQELRGFTGFGGSKFETEADISTPTKALAFLPVGVAFFLLAPFPWQVANLRQGFCIPEVLFFYTLIPAMLRGIKWLLFERLSTSLMIVLIAGGLTVGYALGQANVGTAYRYRAQVLPFYLMFAAIGRESAQRGSSSPVS